MADVTHLRAAGVSLVLDHRGGTLPRVLHWGADLGPVDLDSLALATAPQPVGYSADGPVEVAVVPEQSAGWLGTPGLVGNRGGRAFSTAFRVVEVDGTTFRAVDAEAGLELVLEIELTESGLVRQRASVTNTADSDFAVDGLSVTLPVPAEAVEILDFTGRWTRERSPQRTRFTHGLRVRENRTGRTGFDSAYLMAAGTEGFGNRSGEIWAVHTAWSGNHRTFAERTRHAVSLLGSGELLLSGEVVLAPGETYRSPWQFGSYGVGLDAVSARFHEWMRARPTHPRSPRPVVVNTWEAVYFDHGLTRLKALADKAAEVGAERFVLDDGWFGSRRDDTSGLGDWYVSDEVWPDGLGPLIDHVTGLGMQFGLWVEPEMVNENSDLARAHPDWIMSPGGRMPRPARHQQVLDLATPEAFAYVLERLDDLLTTYDISYLKWDHNRDLVEAGHQGRPGVHGQTVALYRLLDELRARHPRVEIESCSSGGGRVDLEVLQRTDRVWASDCIDALERQSIQRWTNVLVPLELIGSHIGADTSHTTHRRHPVDFRAGTALFGHFGIEWDLMAATPEELDRLTAWVALYKELRGLLHTGTSVHGDHPDPAVAVHGVVAADGTDAVFAIVSTATSDVYPTGAVRLPGLDPDRSYQVRPLPPGNVPDGNPHHWGVALPWWENGVQLTGRALTSTGIQSPVLYPERLVLLRATAI
ncbi:MULTISPECIES: alpha-galactosidase [unclassified Saccharothrix]|uniref:alpha-galactosidase n=1 Tax=unclassified Saccharothrix TaxID=2593673 RepID=UPI00307F21DE